MTPATESLAREVLAEWDALPPMLQGASEDTRHIYFARAVLALAEERDRLRVAVVAHIAHCTSPADSYVALREALAQPAAP